MRQPLSTSSSGEGLRSSLLVSASPPAGLSSVDARDLTDRIKVGVEAVWELVKQAYVSRAWSILGYDSWDDYCTREFGNSRLQLPREERPEVVASMREIGMSTRAIAAATGVSDITVRRELSGATNVAPEPVTGIDGKTYPPKPPAPEPDPASGSAREGIDAGGSAAPAPEPPPGRRRPITVAFWEATHTLTKDTERIARLAADNRFAKNSDRIAGAHLSDLLRARDAVQRVIDVLTPGG
ncbi:hypothetical protein ACIBQ0_09575 [Nocardia nova]|uniref:hypothetical protein n=1 Tax=Nocardia nova TaxID=37330 RepID=UPI0037B08138